MGVQLPNFKEFIEQAYRTVTFATRPGVAAWRFPPHSLATNTFRLLFSLFATPGILIEGFGAGTSFSAAAGLIALTRGQFASVLLCLGGVAMHPPTFCKLLRSYTFFYERDLKLHQDFLEEKRPDKKTRPPNYRPLHSAVEPQHGFLIVQHLHDRRAPWALTPLILSHLYNKGISVLTNFLQLAFPTDDERFPPQKGSDASHFAFALYITSTSGNKGRVGEELPTEQKDTGPTYVTAINGILLPFLLQASAGSIFERRH